MTRVVIDTNVMVSAILAPKGTPAEILKLALEGEFEFILSPLLTQEIREVMRYPKIVKLMKKRGVNIAEVDDFLEKMKRVAINIPGRPPLQTVPDDPKDDMVLACATEGRADFIVSGDSHLTDLKTFQGIPIVNPATFLRLISEAK
jgi:putative PIN family toxin of toxin-antitoxin system